MTWGKVYNSKQFSYIKSLQIDTHTSGDNEVLSKNESFHKLDQSIFEFLTNSYIPGGAGLENKEREVF